MQPLQVIDFSRLIPSQDHASGLLHPKYGAIRQNTLNNNDVIRAVDEFVEVTVE